MARAELQLVGEKALHQTVDPHLLAYCPSMDLLALGSSDQQVLIYRLNGQRVYGTAQKGNLVRVERIEWKPNGQLLAIAWSDGVVRLVGAETSKTVHQISTVTNEVTGITCLGWTSSGMNKRLAGKSSTKDAASWKDFVDDIETSHILDLPRDLSLIDIESSMPKLSALPAGGTLEDVFSSRASLDSIFRPFDPKDNDIIDIMVVGTKDSRVHLSIYDSFVIGTFPSPSFTYQGDLYTGQLYLHASHRNYSTHSLIMKSSSTIKPMLYLVPMDLRFVSSSSGYLSLLASKSTALQNLLRYIQQVQNLMISEWKSSRDLPSRFLGNVNETLAEDSNRPDIVQAMYHSVATGHTIPVVKEWLVDELAERGHKRWDRAVTAGLEALRRLVHENMLPALERCNVILSRLSGIAKFQGSNNTLGFTSQQISLVMDTVLCMNLASARILTYVVDEIDLFASFSAWLRYEIDRLASASSSTPSDDQAEKESAIDHSKVLSYIQSSMTNSRLALFFEDAEPDDIKSDWGSSEQDLPKFDLLDQQLRKHEDGQSHMKALPKLALLCKHLEKQSNAIFQQIAEAEKRNVLFGQPSDLGAASADGLIAMIVVPQDEESCCTYAAIVEGPENNTVRIHRISMLIQNGISTTISTTISKFNLKEGAIKDLAFLDEEFIVILLFTNSNEPRLLRIPFRAEVSYLIYTPQIEKNPEVLQAIDDNFYGVDCYTFPEDVGFVPDTLEIRRGEGKVDKSSVQVARLCVLGKNRAGYKVFVIPDMDKAVVSEKEDDDVSMS